MILTIIIITLVILMILVWRFIKLEQNIENWFSEFLKLRLKDSKGGDKQHSMLMVDIEPLMKKLEEYQANISKIMQDAISHSQTYGKETSDAIQSIKETVEVYAQQINEREEELRRFKGGYDAYVIDRFSDRIAKIHTIMEKEINNSESEKEKELFEDVLEAIEDALSGVGIKSFSPEKGENVNEAYGVIVTDEIETDDPKKHGIIVEVLESGLRIASASESAQPIKMAKVSINKDPTQNYATGENK
ncbi:MAG: hypothetical protein ACR2PR_01950 [Pseudohongiellaceae bacterium]